MAPTTAPRVILRHVLETEVPAMGTLAHLLVVEGDEYLLLHSVEDLRRLEALLSRFVPTSEVSRINRHAGSPVPVSPETLAVVLEALHLRSATGGVFDPLVGEVVRSLGYDRSFEEIRGGVARTRETTRPDGIPSVDQTDSTVCIPAGTALDLGGIAKGWAAERICRAMITRGASGSSVSVGGDSFCTGLGPDPTFGWVVRVQHGVDPRWQTHHPSARPFRNEFDIALPSGGAVATSTVLRRWWRDDRGRVLHHLVDPRTGRSAETRVAVATAVASEGSAAEVYAKAALLGVPVPGDVAVITSSFEGELSARGPLYAVDEATFMWAPASRDRRTRQDDCSPVEEGGADDREPEARDLSQRTEVQL